MNYFNEDNDEINKFNNCLNKTIIMSSKLFFKRTVTRSGREYSFESMNSAMNTDSVLGCYDKEYSRIEDTMVIFKAMESLTAIEQSVILLGFKDDLSRTEIAKKLDIRENRVSKIKTRALNKMKNYLKGDL